MRDRAPNASGGAEPPAWCHATASGRHVRFNLVWCAECGEQIGPHMDADEEPDADAPEPPHASVPTTTCPRGGPRGPDATHCTDTCQGCGTPERIERILNGLDAAANRFHDLGAQAEADRRFIGERYEAHKDAGLDFMSASRRARGEFIAKVLAGGGPGDRGANAA